MDWSIVAWIAGLVFVYLFGIWEGRGKGYKKRQKEEQKEKENQPAPEPPPPQVVTETVTVTVDDPGLLRIKNEGGGFALDLDGARVDTSALSPDQRKRLIELLNVMRPWLEGKPTPAAPAAPPPAQSPLLSRMQSAAASAQPVPPPPPAQTAQIPPAPAVEPRPAVPAPPKPAAPAKDDRPAAPANSMIAQIDAILQAHLAGTPLGERGILLTQSPEGGVNVYIGLTRYNGIDDVPDPEVKTAIRAAITEWENKYTPGL